MQLLGIVTPAVFHSYHKCHRRKSSKCDVLRDLVPFVQVKKRENSHRGVLLLVKLQAFSLQQK